MSYLWHRLYHRVILRDVHPSMGSRDTSDRRSGVVPRLCVLPDGGKWAALGGGGGLTRATVAPGGGLAKCRQAKGGLHTVSVLALCVCGAVRG
jgi:hypothetical protein